MALNVFKTIEKVSGNFVANDPVFGVDGIDFSKPPQSPHDDQMREIQIQLAMQTTSKIEITFNGSDWFLLNNDQDILGLATLTYFVDTESTNFNLRFKTSEFLAIVWIGG